MSGQELSRPLANHHLFLQASRQLFAGKCFYNQREAENASQEFIKPQSMDLYATEINLFLIGKNVLTIIVPIFINKDVSESSYKDLKFSVWNHNYFCTNLTY